MKLSFASLPEEDLIMVCSDVEKIKEIYMNREILVYGGTGFIGTWLTASLLFANYELKLNSKIKIVTRDANRARNKFGQNPIGLEVYQHDLSLSLPKNITSADLVFHCATPSNNSTGSNNGSALIASAINAATHASKLKSSNLDIPIVIHLNSGAIYGKQTSQFRNENDPILTNSTNSYVKSKILIDSILRRAEIQGLINFQSPRLFAFGGPLLALNEHFAIGNFLLNGLKDEKIEVRGNPETTRSYMHASDLVRILLLLPGCQTKETLNIGSNKIITMHELATLISSITSRKGIYLSNPEAETSHYVPSVANLENALGALQMFPIEILLEKWIKWLQNRHRI